MQTNKDSNLYSASFLETQTSLALLLPENRSEGPRFRRSNSGSHSRSKENHRPKQNPSFFVRNCFKQRDTPSPTHKDPTPQKSRRKNNHIRGKEELAHKNTDLQGMAKMCEGLNQLLDKSNNYILELQGRIGELQEELRTKNDSAGKRNKPDRPRESRGNLAKLRKQIAETRTAEIVPSEALAQQVLFLQAENLCLKQQLQSLKTTLHQKQQQSLHARSQRQAQLQALIIQLRQSLVMSEKREGQLEMEVDRLRLRQSKQNDNQQQAKSEELSFMRFRYQKMRKKFQENKRELQVFQRRAEARAYLFPQECEDMTLSLSP